eukprot:766691-Hanusia_phi.AAC.5
MRSRGIVADRVKGQQAMQSHGVTSIVHETTTTKSPPTHMVRVSHILYKRAEGDARLPAPSNAETVQSCEVKVPTVYMQVWFSWRAVGVRRRTGRKSSDQESQHLSQRGHMSEQATRGGGRLALLCLSGSSQQCHPPGVRPWLFPRLLDPITPPRANALSSPPSNNISWRLVCFWSPDRALQAVYVSPAQLPSGISALLAGTVPCAERYKPYDMLFLINTTRRSKMEFALLAGCQQYVSEDSRFDGYKGDVAGQRPSVKGRICVINEI